jgi:uncharacterized protein (TIGR02118 family)
MTAKLLVLYGPPEDATAFDDHYQQTHVPLATKVPGLRSYTISAGPVMTPDGPAQAVHRVATLTWDTLEELQAGLGSPEGGAAAADVAGFATGGATLLIFDERNLLS